MASKEIIEAARVDWNRELVLVWPCSNNPVIEVPFYWFKPFKRFVFPAFNQLNEPNFSDIEVIDYGHTLRLGAYQASADAIIHEFGVKPKDP